MRVLVTGASGYIGSVVAELLAGAGHMVVALARSPASAAALESRGYQVVVGDLRDAASLAAPAAAADAVVHTAATQERDMAEADAAAVGSMLDAVAGRGARFVYTSGCWVYGSAPPGGLLDEDSPTDPVPVYAWRPPLEAALLARPGVPVVVIRPGMVYGRGGGPLNQFAGMAAAGRPRYVGMGENHWSLVHVEDLAGLYLQAVESDAHGVLVNAVQGPPIAVRELAAAATDGHGFAGPPEPWPVADAAGELGFDVAQALTRDHRISDRRAHDLFDWAHPVRRPLDELRA